MACRLLGDMPLSEPMMEYCELDLNLGTNFLEILIEIYIFSFKKMHLKMSSGNWQPFCIGLNVSMFVDDLLIQEDMRALDIENN